MKQDRRILTAAILSGVFIWLIDAIVDYFLYKGTFLGVLILDISPEKFAIRTFLFIYFLVMAFVLSWLFSKGEKAKGEIKRSQQDWGSTFDAVSDPVMVLDKDFRIVMANRATLELLKRPGKEIIGRRCHELVHVTPKSPEFCPTAKAIRTKKREEWEVQLPDGGPWLAISVDPILDDNGEISSFVHIVRDVTGRKANEEKLKLSAAIIEQSAEGLAAVDNSGNIIFSNKAFAGMHGYEKEELIGKNICLLHTPDQMPSVEEANRKLRETGGFSGEVWHVRRNGTVFPGWMQNTLLRDEQGRMAGAIGTLQDITEQKSLGEQLREDGERYRNLFSESSIGSVVNSVEGKIIQVNRAFCDFVGYSEDELVGRQVIDITHPEDREKTAEAIRQMMADTKPINRYEKRYMHKSGEVKWGEVNAAAIPDSSGKPIYAIAQIQNITERKEAESELMKLSLVVKNSSELINLALPDGKMIFLNEAGSRMLGITPLEMHERSIMDVISEDLKETVRKELLPALERGDDWKGELRYKNLRTGRLTDVYAICFPIKSIDTGKVLYYANSSLDITERKKAEEELNKYKDHLEIMVKERTEELESFSYLVSHDLRAPIRAIDGFACVLSEEFGEKLNQEGKRIIDVIVTNTKNMGQLVDDLLAFSHLGRREAQPDEIDMEALVKDMAEGLIREATGRKVELKTGRLPSAFGDRAMIRLALANLLSNALKFTRKNENARIEIGAEEKAGEIVYSIRDNGVGFDMKYASKLFGVFQRLHGHEEFEGTGIGLALVKRIITKHGGRVWAEGEEGRGATFYFSLPKRSS